MGFRSDLFQNALSVQCALNVQSAIGVSWGQVIQRMLHNEIKVLLYKTWEN
jgi:hypothetical protein